MKDFDEECVELCLSDYSLLVPWYLTASYLYYKEDFSLLTDTTYDWVCKKLLDNWDEVEHHHKYLVDKDQLTAGTGYALEYDSFPLRVISAAQYRRKLLECNSNSSSKPKAKKSRSTTVTQK